MNGILVVDDDPRIRELVTCSLEMLGHEAIDADAAATAMARLERQRFGLVLIDVHMPGRDGMSLAAEIRERFPATAVIMLTGDDQIPAVVGSLRAGAMDYLVKPVPREMLAQAVDRGLAWHRKALLEERTRRRRDLLLSRRQRQITRALADLDLASATSADALLRLLTLHDSDSYGHATRVAETAGAIAEALGLPGDARRVIRHAALLHDIGKVAVVTSVLRKPAALDGGEVDLMRQHPERGYDVLRDVPHLRDTADIVLAHHEHFDGSGYARGLAGEDIPIGARVLTVADAFDALTHDRPYRPGRDPEAARLEILRCSGQQFDPRVVDAFIR